MRRSVIFGLCLALLLGSAAVLAEDDKRTLKGTYVWNVGEQGDLTAYFSPTAESDTWDVEFHFKFNGPHVYVGTATGSLDEGALTGEVRSDQRKRTFTFTGSFRDGKFKGTHAETTRGRRVDTGTLSLR